MSSLHPATSGTYRFPTAFGDMAIVWAESGKNGSKITATFLPAASNEDLLAQLRSRLANPDLAWALEAPAFVLAQATRIQRHLQGDLQEFPLHDYALEKTSPFFRRVYECANRIPAGTVLSYGELARVAGSEKASRAVGQAMARNPFPLVVPCHRVVGGNKAMVGFSAPGGIATKQRLLQLESTHAHG